MTIIVFAIAIAAALVAVACVLRTIAIEEAAPVSHAGSDNALKETFSR